MGRGLTGQYAITQVAGEQIQAFIPFPLPCTGAKRFPSAVQIEGTQSSLTQLLLFELDAGCFTFQWPWQ